MWTATDGTNTYNLAGVSINKQIDGLDFADITVNTDIATGTVLTIKFGDLQVFKGVVTKKNVIGNGEYQIHLVEEAIELQNMVVQDANGNYVFTESNIVLNDLIDLILTNSGWTRISSDTTTTIPAISFTYSTKLDALYRVIKDYVGEHLWFGDGQLSRTDTVGTGDGTTTAFSATLTYTPVVAGTVTVNYTIGGTAYSATDDGAGNISGTDVTGTIDYSTGAISLTFTTAPDASTSITAAYQQYISKGVYFGSTRNAYGTVEIIQQNEEESIENRDINIVIVFGNKESVYGIYNDGLGSKTAVFKYGDAKTADECAAVAAKIYDILKNEYKRIEIITKIQPIEPGDTVTIGTTDYTVYEIEIDEYSMTLHLNAKRITLFDVFGDKLVRYSGSVQVGDLVTHSFPGQWMLFGSTVGCKYTFNIDDVTLVKNYTINVTLDQYRKGLSYGSNTTSITNASAVTNITNASALTNITNASNTTGVYNSSASASVSTSVATGVNYEVYGSVPVYSETTVSAGTTSYWSVSWTSNSVHDEFMVIAYLSIRTASGSPDWCYLHLEETLLTSTTYSVTVKVAGDSTVIAIPSIVTHSGSASAAWQLGVEAPFSDLIVEWLAFTCVGFGHKSYISTDAGHNHTVNDGGHTHTVTDNGHTHSITDNGHTHSVTDPGHSHPETDDVALLASYPSNVLVYVNGTQIGTIAGGAATTVSYDITANLINGENTIEFKPDTVNGSTPGSIYISPKATMIVF